jgi:cyclopropane-fatty-acyl-phospholipid synthase
LATNRLPSQIVDFARTYSIGYYWPQNIAGALPPRLFWADMVQELTGRLQDDPPSISWPLRTVLRYTVRSGALEVRDCSGKTRRFGDGTGPLLAIEFTDRQIERELLFDPQLAFGEGYMQGRILVRAGTLYDVIALLARNIEEHPFPAWMGFANGLRRWTRWTRQLNRPGRSKRNVAHHYDLPGELYELFLDEDRQYSCAYFPAGNETLAEAQLAKKRLIAAKLCLSPGQSVLDIGSGWGGLALHLAKNFRVNVTGITLSEEQEAYAKARAGREAASNVSFRLADYRSLTEKFDRIVSVGMFEHVGIPNYRTFFKKLYSSLKEDGVALLHTIGRLDGPGITHPFMEKYIFPGGYVPAFSEVMPAIEDSGLLVTDIEVWRLHYAKTLAAWRENFCRRWDEAAAMLSEEFCRMWECYLAGCEAGFRHQKLAVFHIQLAKRVDGVPLARDYLQNY